MAGHSHWANIARKKAVVDAKRGKMWSKLSRAIIVAAKMGGADPDTNLRLRYAINDAKAVSMPKDNIERAIKKGAGDLDGDAYEEVVYEGTGPAGTMVMVEILTDNRNRTAPEIRKVFEKGGGALGATGSAGWMFQRKGVVVIPADQTDEESLMDLALEAGADEVEPQGEAFSGHLPARVVQRPLLRDRVGRRPHANNPVGPVRPERHGHPLRRRRQEGARPDGSPRRPRRRSASGGQLRDRRGDVGGAGGLIAVQQLHRRRLLRPRVLLDVHQQADDLRGGDR